MKTCSRCEETKALTGFGKRKLNKDGHYGICKSCRNSEKRDKAKTSTKICNVASCGRTKTRKDYCDAHYDRVRRTGDVKEDIPLRSIAPKGSGSLNGGCRVVFMPEHPNAWASSGQVFEHVVVMSGHLGRMLLPHENVHHKNGDKLDNRLENLELWSKHQPSGQRVEDKIQWAKELLALYEPTALSDITDTVNIEDYLEDK
jgi:hypothetical protein